MSRKVIEDLVLPIVIRKLRERGELPRHSQYATIRDRHLTDFFKAQLVKEFGAIGEVGGRCEALRISSRTLRAVTRYTWRRKLSVFWICT